MNLSRVGNPSLRLLLGCAGALLSLLSLSLLDVLTNAVVSIPAMIPPFGATVMIVFFLPESPMGRDWNVVTGHVVSAFVANLVLALCPWAPVGVKAALAVTACAVAMFGTRSFHPPGGATALLTVLAPEQLGFVTVFCPTLIGAVSVVVSRHALDRALAVFAAQNGEGRQVALLERPLSGTVAPSGAKSDQCS